MSITKSVKVYICGCARNCAKDIPSTFVNVEKIAALFDDYEIVVAFDKSNDMTLQELCVAKSRMKNMQILINQQDTGPFRTQNIANARNSILQYIRQKQQSDYEYMIMMDFDDVCSGSIQLNILQKYVEAERSGLTSASWDALSFNRPGYYDIWALSIEPFVFSCWHFTHAREVVEKTKNFIENRLQEVAKQDPNGLLSVMSAFNGFAIYRIAKFEGVKYEWNVMRNTEIISQDLIDNTVQAVGQQLNINRTEQDCEHRYFHIRATQMNGARICVSPECLFTDRI